MCKKVTPFALFAGCPLSVTCETFCFMDKVFEECLANFLKQSLITEHVLNFTQNAGHASPYIQHNSASHFGWFVI
jgi:hypothetical protein